MTACQGLSLNCAVSATKNQVFSELAGEAVILHLDRGVYFGLDEVGTRIWQLLQESKPLREVRDIIVREYDVAPQQCEQDLFSLVEKLVEEGLVVVNHAPAAE
jgi:hypothetical protein